MKDDLGHYFTKVTLCLPHCCSSSPKAQSTMPSQTASITTHLPGSPRLTGLHGYDPGHDILSVNLMKTCNQPFIEYYFKKEHNERICIPYIKEGSSRGKRYTSVEILNKVDTLWKR